MLRSIMLLISLAVIFLFMGCSQHIKTDIVHYPTYWAKMGYGTSQNIKLKIVPAEESNEAKRTLNIAMAKELTDYMGKQQHTLKIVSANSPSDMRLILALSYCKTKTDSQEHYDEEIVYKKDKYGVPLRDKNGNRIPVWMTDQYGRHLYDDEGRPLIKTEKIHYTITYNEVDCHATATLVNEKTKETIDTYWSKRSYWSRGVNPDTHEALALKSLTKILEDFYVHVAPYTFVLEVTDKNILRTAKQDLDNNGELQWTDNFQQYEQSGRIILRLPSTADNNEFEIVVVGAGAAINAPDARIISIPLVWKAENDQISYEFSPSSLFTSGGSMKKYDFHLVQNGKSLLYETVTISPSEE